jgi:hypothetical protein
MRRLVCYVFLGAFFLAVLPVVGTEVGKRNHGASTMVAEGGSSIHFKNSQWPYVSTYHVAVGSGTAARVAI